MFTVYDCDAGILLGYSASTGQQIWSQKVSLNDFANIEGGVTGTDAYGNQYLTGYDGYLHCVNLQTGNVTWATPSQGGGLEMPQPNYPFMGAPLIADNTVFTTTGKSYETSPLYRGHDLYAFNAQNGQQMWNISGQYQTLAISDGILVGSNNYDNTLYAFGLGQTATTVTAPMTQVTVGSNVIIQGTVTDQSPGAKGTPAISDTWMTPWMEYVYMDQPKPTQATGVPMSIDAIDPNGNYISIRNATSDITGAYSYTWTPANIPSTYHIIATFAGSNSYYGSSSVTTAVNVASPTTAVAPTATPTSVADIYFVPAIAGLFVLIIVVAIVLALLMLRKRP